MIKENEACKKIISEFLYPNDKVKKFLTRDLNEELNEIIDNNTLINEDNRVDSIRQSNLWENVKSVGNFLQKNSDYYEAITKIWGSNDIIDNIRLILLNYVFCLCMYEQEYSDINIFTDSRCITCENFL